MVAVVVGMLAVVLVGAEADAYPGAPWFRPSTTYTENFPDPHIVRDGNTWYAYATNTGGAYLPVMTSSDAVTWTARPAYNPAHHGLGHCNPANDQQFNDALPCPPSWALREPGDHDRMEATILAPGVAKIGGQWRAYYMVLYGRGNPDRYCLSVATSSSPLGPFVDNSSRPLHCDTDPGGSVDPAPYIDEHGNPWLLWRSYGVPGSTPARIWSRRLNASGTGFLGGSSANMLLQTALSWEGSLIENPSMVRYQGTTWLLYSANEWRSPHYRTGHAACSGPAGPCNRASNSPLLANIGERTAQGGASVELAPDGRLVVAYHWWNAPYSDYPNCAPGATCATQGQRRMSIGGLLPTGGGRLTSNPVGSFDSLVTGAGPVTVSGWVIDPDKLGPAELHVTVNGSTTAHHADKPRPDLVNTPAYAPYGANHGFTITVDAPPGQAEVCVHAINRGAGTGNTPLGCKQGTVAPYTPFGSLDLMEGGPRQLRARGWAIDPDSATPVQIAVVTGGGEVATLTADQHRPDVGNLYPEHGSNRGFDATFELAPGSHHVCVVARNTPGTNGSDTTLGCQTVWVQDPDAAFVDLLSTDPFHEAIARLADMGVIGGYDDGTFRPVAPVTRQAAVAFLWRIAGEPAAAGGTDFPDVGAGHPFAAAVAWAVNEGITTGYIDGTFRPTAPVSRQAMVTFLWRMAGEPAAAGGTGFPDVGAGHPFAAAVAWAVDEGITSGYGDGTFRPTTVVSRQAAAAFIHRANPELEPVLEPGPEPDPPTQVEDEPALVLGG